ncbi:MAG: hypothetical protein ACTSRA_14675, partial [Promethearchaeota archaeon]
MRVTRHGMFSLLVAGISFVLGGILIVVSLFRLVKNDFGFFYLNPAAIYCISFGIVLIVVFLGFNSVITRACIELTRLVRVLSWKFKVLLVSGIVFSFIFLMQKLFLFLPRSMEFLMYIPIFPIYLIKILSEFINPPNSWDVESFTELLGILFGLPITALLYYALIFVLLKADFLKIKSKLAGFIRSGKNDTGNLRGTIDRSNQHKQSGFSSRILTNLRQKEVVISFLPVILIIICFSGGGVGFDNPFYYMLMKISIERGDLRVFFDPSVLTVNGRNNFSASGTLFALPVCLFLMPFALACGGNVETGVMLGLSLLTFFELLLYFKIVEKLTSSKKVAWLSQIILTISYPFLEMNFILFKQMFATFLSILLIFIYLHVKNKNPAVQLIKWISISFLLICTMTYSMFLGMLILLAMIILLTRAIFLRNASKPEKFIVLSFLAIFIAGFSMILLKFFNNNTLGFLTPIFTLLIQNNQLGVFLWGYKILDTPTLPDYFDFSMEMIYYVPFFMLAAFQVKVFGKRNDVKENTRVCKLVSYLNFFVIIICLFYVFGFNFFHERFNLLLVYSLSPNVASSIYHIFNKYKYLRLGFNRFGINGKWVLPTLFIILFIVPGAASTTLIRRGTLHPSELDGIKWIKDDDDQELLTNNILTDVSIICNGHLVNWVYYKIH